MAVEKSWRYAQVAILFGQASRQAAFSTNDSERYWCKTAETQRFSTKPFFYQQSGEERFFSTKVFPMNIIEANPPS